MHKQRCKIYYRYSHCSVREVVKLLDSDFFQYLKVRSHQERRAAKVEPIPQQGRGVEWEGKGKGSKMGRGWEGGGGVKKSTTTRASTPAGSYNMLTYPQRSPYFRQSCVLRLVRYFCSRNVEHMLTQTLKTRAHAHTHTQ